MPSVAEVVDAVVGVDTHADTHAAEISTSTGVVLAAITVSNSSSGFQALLQWIVQHAPGPQVVVGVEGTRSYGLGLTRTLQAAGLVVVECEQPARKERRGRGKSDPIDAHHAVMSVLRMPADQLPTPRADGDRDALRILLGARHDLTVTKTAGINRLKALLRTGDDNDQALAARAVTVGLLTRLARRRGPRECSRAEQVRQQELRRLAVLVREAEAQLVSNNRQLARIVADLAPGLTARAGIGPVSAAQSIVSFSHPGRVRNDAAFAALAGTSPLEASSGRTSRHRLNRGGDRQLNKAIHTIASTRMRDDPRTRSYVERRTAEGLSPSEIRRCLKRYITRELYRYLNRAMSGRTPA
jgi:transposase